MSVGRRRSTSVALILLVLALVGIGVVALSWWPRPDVLGEDARFRPATAVVIESTPCGASTQGDKVEVTVDGKPRQARFDGCGHTKGQQLPVRVPVDSGGEFVVRSAEPDEGSGGNSVPQRLNWVLLTLAAIAGGGYALMLRGRLP